MRISIEAQDFNRLMYNAQLFSPAKGATGGRAYFDILQGGSLEMTACDDFVIVRDGAGFETDEYLDLQFTLALADIKKLDVLTREIKEPIELEISEGKLILNPIDPKSDPEDLESVEVFDIGEPEGFWHSIVNLIEDDHPFAGRPDDLYLNPKRVAQISRMHLEGDHPIGLRYILNDSGEQMLSFIYGPTIRGVITTQDVAHLEARGAYVW